MKNLTLYFFHIKKFKNNVTDLPFNLKIKYNNPIHNNYQNINEI